MKNHLFLFMIILLPSLLMAQTPDIEETASGNLDSLMEHMLAPLDKSDITTGLLLDRGFQTEDPSLFDGSGSADTIHNYLQWYSVYTTLATGRIGANVLPILDSWKSTAESYKENNVITFPTLHIDYHRFIQDSTTLTSLIYEQNGQLFDNPNQPTSPYVQETAFAATPYVSKVYDSLEVNFRFDNALFFTNTNKTLQNIKIDFGDGQGLQNVNTNQNYSVTYSTFGQKELKVQVNYTDQSSYTSKTELLLKESNPGSGVSSMGLIGYNQYPDHEERITLDRGSGFSRIGANIQVEYGCGNYKLRKPFIVVEGFNPAEFYTGPRGLDYGDFYDNLFNYPWQPSIQEKFEESGYDIVYVDFDEGAGDIRGNAYLVMEVIDWVNQQKAENNSDEPNVVWGESMGGLVARYALRQMELDNRTHDVSYYYSFDSPHQGANVPKAVQYMARDLHAYTFGDYNPIQERLQPVVDVLNKTGTKQLLRSYASSALLNPGEPPISNIYEFGSLQNEFQSMGMPTQTLENIAIANGNGDGYGQGFSPGANIFEADINSFNSYNSIPDPEDIELPGMSNFAAGFIAAAVFGSYGRIQIEANSLPNYSSSYEILYERKVRAFSLFLVFFDMPILTWDTYRVRTKYARPYDSAPGGTYRLSEFSGGDDILAEINGLHPDANANLDYFNFVPTFSALNMSSLVTNPYGQIDPVSAVNNGLSTFDRAYVLDPTVYSAPANNEIHVDLTPSSVLPLQEFLFNYSDELNSLSGASLNDQFNVSQATLPNGDIVRTNDRLSETIELNNTVSDYSLCVNCDDRIGYLNNSNNPLSTSELYSLSLVRSCDDEYGTIIVRNGTTLKLGESSAKRGNVYIGGGCSIVVESGGKIEINEGSKLLIQEDGELVVEGGGQVEIHEDSKISVEDGGKLIIDSGQIVSNQGEIIIAEGGKMDYFENSDIQLNGSDAILSLAGLTYIKDNAVFGFSYTGNESGHIEIAEGTWGVRFRTGENTQIHLEGEGDDDLILDIIGSDFWAEPDNGEGDEPPVNITLSKGRIDFHDGGARFYANREFYAFLCHFTHPPGQLPSGYSNRGIRLGGDSRFMACEFTRVPIDGRLDFTQSGMLDLAVCDLDRSDVYLRTRGFEFSSCTFERSSVRSENCTVLSEIDASDFHLSPVEDYSSNQLKVNRSTFDNAPGRFALYKDAGRLLVRCSEFTDNDIAVFGSSAEIIMSDAKSTGYNELYGNDINLKTYNLENLNITFGYNMFVSGDDYNIYGLWHEQPYDFLCPSPLYTVDFRGNLWSANPPTSVPPYPYPDPAQFDLTSRIQSGEPFGECQVNPQFGSIVSSMPSCPSSSVPGRSSSSSADTTLADYFADAPNDSIPLISTDTYGEILADTALYLANNLLEINDSLSQNSLAMSAFKDVLTSLKDSISHDYTRKLAFDGISGMKTAFEHEEAQNGFESSGSFSPMVQDYVDVLMLYTDSVKTEENYNRQFYLETKKASLFNTLGNLNLSEQILGNLNLCEHDSLEQDYLDKYSNMLGNQIALSEVGSYELMMDSTLSETLLDSTYSSSPPNQTVGDQGFAAFIEGPNTVQFTTCPVGQQKSLDVSSDNKSSLAVVPNPALDYATVSSFTEVTEQKAKGELQVFSSQGRKVFSQEYVIDGGFSERISVENLTVGSYIVVLNVNGKAYRAHLVVVK